MRVPHSPLSGWTGKVCRIYENKPVFLFPPVLIIVLVYFQINIFFYLHWICTSRFDTAFDIWNEPVLYGWSLVNLFQTANILLGIFVVIIFLLHIRVPRKQHITNRIACLLSLGLLILLHAFHTCCREFPRDYFRSTRCTYSCHLGDIEIYLRVQKKLILPDNAIRISASAREVNGYIWHNYPDWFSVKIPGNNLNIPLNGLTLRFIDGVLKGDSINYGTIMSGDRIEVTPVGVFVNGEHRGELH